MANILLQLLLLALGLTITFIAISLRARINSSPSRNRMYRAIPSAAGKKTPSVDLPSIARARYAIFRSLHKKDTHQHFAKLFIGLDDLLRASGLQFSIWIFFASNVIVSAAAATIFSMFLSLSIPFISFIMLPSTLMISLHLLVRLKTRKLQRFQELFPEALDLMVRSVRAGLPVSEAVKMIGTEVGSPVRESFQEISSNLTIGMSLDESLGLLQKNIPLPEVKFFAISLTIQQETGGNLAEILSNLASIMRKRVQIGKKIRALSSEARASAYIIGCLPFLVGSAIYLLNREYIEVLLFDDLGQLFLLGALTSVAAGAIVMAKLVRFEI